MTDAKKEKLHAWGSDPISNDQLNVTLKLVAVQMHIHHVFHHIAFSPADCGHVDRRSRWEIELRASPG